MAIDWQIGDRIENRWEILSIRRGGMGTVYIVRDTEWGIDMAAKEFQDAVFARDARVADRFRQEAEVWIALDVHPNIVQAILVRSIHDKPMIFLEFVETDLDHWVSSKRLADDVVQVLRFAIQFCDGITYAYSKGIKAHRDVKPSNCLVTTEGILKVSDFGLVSIWDVVPRDARHPPRTIVREGLPDLTGSGIGLGTPAYMAPEQFLDAHVVDSRADVYAFGIMLFEMLTARLPFEGTSNWEWAQLHAKALVPQLSGTVPSDLNRLIQRCTSKEPSARYANFDDIRQTCADLYRNLTGDPPPTRAVTPTLDSAQWRRKGIGLADLGRLPEALECFEESLRCDNSDSATWQCKGATLGRMGRRNEALECSERAIAADPSSAKAWSGRAFDLLTLDRPDEALESADQSLKLDPSDWSSHTLRAAILNRLNKHTEAADSAARALEIYDKADTAWTEKGKALRSLGKNDAASDCFDRAIAYNGNNDYALSGKAEILMELRQFAEAIPFLDKALVLTPTSWSHWWDKGVALVALHKPHEEALHCFNQCVQLVPQHSRAWYERGASLHELGKLEEALDSYDRALNLDAKYEDALKAKATALRELGRGKEALNCSEKLVELNPNSATAWNDNGACLCSVGRLSDAMKCFVRALQIDPNDAKALHNKAVLSEILKQRDAGS